MTRKSRREIENDLDELDGTDDVEQITVVEMFSYDFESVEGKDDIVRLETGELRRFDVDALREFGRFADKVEEADQ